MSDTPVQRDARGYRRTPQTYGDYHRGRVPRNKGRRYPADPPTVEEIVAVINQAGMTPSGLRVRALVAILWRAGLRIHEALLLSEHDLDQRAGSVTVRRGKGGKRRVVGMDDWGWELVAPWLEHRRTLPVGPLFCVITGPTQGRAWSYADSRAKLKNLAEQAGVRRRFAPHQLRHAHAVELAREGIALNIIQRQLGHSNLGVTSIYLQGIDQDEIISTVHGRRPPSVSATSLITSPAQAFQARLDDVRPPRGDRRV